MDKIKQVMSRGKDKEEQPESTVGSTGKLTGQGSHFGAARQASSTYTGMQPMTSKRRSCNDNLGSTTAGSEPQTIGAADTSAANISPSAARDTAGPEAGGQSHVGTISAEDAGATTRRGDEGAAIGTTSTYSTTHLTKGDPTSSVIDPESTDPITYKKPEATSHARDTGVPEGAAQTAASKAFSSHHNEGMPGAYPTAGYENPYKAANLDPRVDGLPYRSNEEVPASSASHTLGTSAAGAGATGLAAAGAATAVSEHEKARENTGPAPSALSSTTNPADRSAEYSQAEKTKVPEAAAATAMSSHDGTNEPQQSSIVGKVLGAVGLGSLAGAGAAAATHGHDSAVDTTEGPVTTTGTDSYRSPSMSGPPPSHHRKESIPTTAYPAGPGSAKPIAPPVGGTGPPTEQADTRTQNQSHLGRDAAIGAGAVGIAGAGAVGAHEYEQSRALRENTTGQPSSLPTSGGATTAVPAQQYDQSKDLREGTTAHHATTTPAAAESTIPQEKEDHTKRNAALAGAAGVGAAGAGAYAVTEHSREQAEQEAARRTAEHQKEMARQQKEIESQRAAQAKEAEKQQKAAEKEHAKEVKAAEKEQAKEEKAAAKEQKQAEKDAEKQRKEEQATAAIAAERQRKEMEEEERRRREKELGAGAVGAGAVGAGAAAYGADKEGTRDTTQEGAPLEKKPSLLKRIFKRKNKDTGEDEEYEGEEEEDSHKGVAAAGVAGAGAAGGATYAIAHDPESGAPKLQSTAGTPTKYEEKSGGFIKPSYNPFTKKGEPEGLAGTADINNDNASQPAAPVPHERETTPVTSSGYTSTTAGDTTGTTAGTTAGAASGLSQSTEHTGRNRLHKDPPADHPAAQREAITDLPYDSSKDPQTAGRLSEHHHGSGMGEGTSAAKKLEHEEEGEEHHRGLREKLKDKLGLGHHESDQSH